MKKKEKNKNQNVCMLLLILSTVKKLTRDIINVEKNFIFVLFLINNVVLQYVLLI